MTLEIDKMLTCSTAHVTEYDSHVIETQADNDRLSCVVYTYEYGWILQTKNHQPMLSEAANKLLAFARDQGCNWLRLDQDGLVIDTLEIFDW